MNETLDFSALKATIKGDLSEAFKRFNVETKFAPIFSRDETKDIEITFTNILNREDRLNRPSILVKHDIFNLALLQHLIKENRKCMCLTWDKILCKTSEEINVGWIVPPDILLDILSPFYENNDDKFCSLTKSLALFPPKDTSIGVQLLDKIIEKAGSRMLDWQFKQTFEEFREDLIKRIEKESQRIDLDDEINEFLRKQEITEKKEPNGGGRKAK
jgi:hypothetical protein